MAQPAPPTKLLASPLLPGCESWISVDGKPLNVYSSQVEGDKSTDYVEVVEGAHFEIKYREGRQQAPANDYVVDAYLDGRRELLSSQDRIETYSSAEINSTSERPFLFSKLAQTDDDEVACKAEKVIKAMGTIQLKIRRIKDVHDYSGVSSDRMLPDIVLHEQTKKAMLSHQASLGPVVTHEPLTSQSYTSIDSSDKPFYTFEFRYRS